MQTIYKCPSGASFLIKPSGYVSDVREAVYSIYSIDEFGVDYMEGEITFDTSDTTLLFTGKAYLADGNSAIDVMPIIREYVDNSAVCDFTKGYDYYDDEGVLRPKLTGKGDGTDYFAIMRYFYVTMSYRGMVYDKVICTWYDCSGQSMKEGGYDRIGLSGYPLPKSTQMLIEDRVFDGTYFSNTYLRSSYDEIFYDESVPMEKIYMRVWRSGGTVEDIEVDTLEMMSSMTIHGRLVLSSYVDDPSDITHIQMVDCMEDSSEERTEIGPKLRVERCMPDDIYILYYQNLYGAVDWLACTLKSQVTVNAERNSIQHRPNDTDRTKFGTQQYLNVAYDSFTLNTELLDDRQSRLMRQLFLSTKVWLYDPREDRIRTVVITDKSLKIKKFSIDRMYNYTITCQDSTSSDIR